MRTALCIAAFAGIAYSAPQLIDLDEIAQDFAPPALVKAPINVVSNVPAPSAPVEITPLESISAKKRDLEFTQVEKRDGDCSPYPAGSGPVPNPDTPEAFQSDPDFASMANNAPTPDGYSLVFHNAGASLSASNYMGLYTLTSYDVLTCASKCDQASGCAAFNVYLERDPTVNANQVRCPNPPSTTNYRCTLWGAPVSEAEATNSGQYQASFHVVIAGSNGYNKAAPPPAINGYVGPQELGGAINAPTDSGSYMGYQYFPFSQSQGYTPQTCANACDAQTLYDSQHPAADGSFMSCVFFNAYVLSKNAIPQGLYCSMYNQTWGPSYGTNYGQYRGSDRYTVSESYSYTKSSYSNPPPPKSSSKPTSSSPSRTTTPASTSPTTAPTCAPTPSTNLVKNGGFECGIAPWVPADLPHTTHSLASPGDNSPSAYEFRQTGPVDPTANTNPASLNQDLALTAGRAYTLTFRTYFATCASNVGFVGVKLNQQPVYTVDACDYQAGQYNGNTIAFVADGATENLRFEFLIGAVGAVARIDNVVVVPA